MHSKKHRWLYVIIFKFLILSLDYIYEIDTRFKSHIKKFVIINIQTSFYPGDTYLYLLSDKMQRFPKLFSVFHAL